MKEKHLIALLKVSLDYNASMIAVAAMVVNAEDPVKVKNVAREFNRLRKDYNKKVDTIIKEHENGKR
jgi:hypothetical protein